MKQENKFLYEIVYNTLKEEVLNKVYPPDVLLPSEKEIAIRFGVERSTVRKGLDLLVRDGLVTKQPGVGTRVIGEEDTHLHNSGMNNEQKRNIGFFVLKDTHQITQPYYADLFFNLEHECKRHGIQMMYITVDGENTLHDAMAGNKYVGLIFVASIPDKYIEEALGQEIPVAIINRFHEQAVCIMANHLKGARIAINYLIEMGHRNIGIIRGPEDYISDEDKMAGCLHAAFENNIVFDRRLILRGNWEFQSGYENAKHIFSRCPSVSALFCFNDIMALGAIKALREMNITVGKDVSVIGFDNMEQLKFTEPDLTTVDCNISQVARMAIEHVLLMSKGIQQPPVTMHVPVKLITGNTVSTFPIGN